MAQYFLAILYIYFALFINTFSSKDSNLRQLQASSKLVYIHSQEVYKPLSVTWSFFECLSLLNLMLFTLRYISDHS